MDIDERLAAFAQGMDKLKERQESFHEKFQEDMERLKDRHEALTQTVEYNQHQFALHEQLFGEIALRFKDTRETIDRLARIAGVHQDRLGEHEHRLENLEPH